MSETHPLSIGPLYVGRDNAVGVMGRSWRAVQDLAAQLGVQPRRVGRIALYPADELRAAIERRAPTKLESDDGANALAAMRERIRKAG